MTIKKLLYIFSILLVSSISFQTSAIENANSGEPGGNPGEPGRPEKVSATVNLTFETYQLGYEFESSNGNSYSEVVPNPTIPAEKSLQVDLSGYDGYFTTKIEFPAQYTFKDYHTISFDIYCETDEQKELIIKIGDAVYKSAAPLEMTKAGEWVTHEIKIADLGFGAIHDINTFIFGLGLNDNSLTYWLDNIKLISDKYYYLSIDNPTVNLSEVYLVPGGIITPGVLNEIVTVYGVNGNLVRQTRTSGSLIPLRKGMYIVKVGSAKAIKMAVR